MVRNLGNFQRSSFFLGLKSKNKLPIRAWKVLGISSTGFASSYYSSSVLTDAVEVAMDIPLPLKLSASWLVTSSVRLLCRVGRGGYSLKYEAAIMSKPKKR